MKRLIKLTTPATIRSFSAVGGYEEGRGPLGKRFDHIDERCLFGKDTWEKAEAEMSRTSLNLALTKASLSHEELDLIVAGDLQNQCVASAIGLSSFGKGYLGIYGACSCCAEGLVIASSLLSQEGGRAAVVTSSHNSAAERQFRMPVEYGGQRTPSAGWTSTAAASFILEAQDGSTGDVCISNCLIGKMVDGATTDGSNLGGAMAFAALDSILTYFELSGESACEFDYIVTGDLGKVGSLVLGELLSDALPAAAPRHIDCGNILYGTQCDVHGGASGCGTSAAVLATHFLPKLQSGELSNILFFSTGALMSPSSLLQGESIIGIAHGVKISRKDFLSSERGNRI